MRRVQKKTGHPQRATEKHIAGVGDVSRVLANHRAHQGVCLGRVVFVEPQAMYRHTGANPR